MSIRFYRDVDMMYIWLYRPVTMLEQSSHIKRATITSHREGKKVLKIKLCFLRKI